MCTATVPATAAQALAMLDSAAALQESALGFLAVQDPAAQDPAALPAQAAADRLRALERHDAVEVAVRARLLQAFDAQDGHLADGQRTTRAWLIHCTRVTKAQAAEYKAIQALTRDHQVLLAALAEGDVLTKSAALQVAKWTKAIPGRYRDQAEEILVGAARGGADLRGLAAICAEIRALTAQPDPDGRDPGLDRALTLDTTLDGAGVLRADLTPGCAAMVQAVLDALAAPQGGEDPRTRPQRYHDALEEAMRRLLASDLLPKRAGQPVKALVHVSFADLCQLDAGSGIQDQWIGVYRARWAAHRAAASVCAGDGGAWLEGDAARAVACDAMIIPVVTADIDPAAVEDLILLCVRFHELRTQTPPADPADPVSGTGTPGPAETGAQDRTAAPDASVPVPAGLAGSTSRRAETAAQVTAAAAAALAELEHQILATILQVVSGPGGAASALRRQLLGKPLAGPSLPLDIGQSDDIPVHLRRLVALRDPTCQYPGGCDQPASACEPHHVVHRKDGGRTSLANLKDYCWWHHHVVLHELGWILTVHPDGTSQVQSPDGNTIHSHSPPPRPG